MAVRIRMKKMGRKHRPFFRICAVDSRHPRDGRVLEELGTYDPLAPETDARALLKAERVSYWLGVGAQPSENVAILIKKYGASGTHVEQQKAARERMASPKAIPDPGAPAYIPPVKAEPAPSEAPESAKHDKKGKGKPAAEKPAAEKAPAAESAPAPAAEPEAASE